MDNVTFAWTVLTTLFAGTQLFVQRVIAKEERDGAFAGFVMYAISLVLALILLLYTYELPEKWLLAAVFGLASGAIHGFGNFLRIESLKDIDSVLYFPINKVLGPIIVVMGGVFLFSELLSMREFIGIALSLTVPLLLISSTEHLRQNNLRRGLTLMITSTILTAIAMLLSKQGTGYDSDILFLLVMTQVAGTVSSAVIFFRKKRGRTYFSHLDRRDIVLGVTVAILGFLSYYTFLRALTTGYVSLVYVIHAHYILIPIILSVWWYKEHINFRKLAAVVVSSLAIGLLYSA